MAFKDLFTKKKNTTDNPASSCCNVEIAPDDQPEQSASQSQAADARDSSQGQ